MSAIQLSMYTAFLNQRKLSIEEAAQYQILGTEAEGARIVYKDLDDDVLMAVDGKPFERMRLYKPTPKTKYLQRTGSGTAAYLPQHPEIVWPFVAGDADTPIMITEGEFKALEACRKWGLPCIGLGGVNSWSPGKKEPKANLCRPLDQFVWVNRVVFIVFDYDGTPDGGYKPSVEIAAQSFAAKLSGLGSKVSFLYIGKTARAVPGSKSGLDDYIQAGGDPDELLGTRVEYVGDPNLSELMNRFAFYAPTPAATIIDLEDGSTQTLASWQSRNRHRFTHAVVNGKIAQKRTTEVWLDSKERLTVLGYCFRPGEPPGLTADMYYNLWEGFGVQPLMSLDESGRQKLEMWLSFSRRLFGEHWPWVERWCAHLMQRPEQKCTITITVLSAQEGIGKTLFGDFLARIIGSTHAKYIGVNQMFEKHTEWPRGTLLAVVNELQSGYERHEDQLKDLVTAERCWINPKGLREYAVEALFRMYFTTNRDYPFRLTADSRRHFVYRPDLLAGDASWKQFLKGSVGPLVDDEEALGAIHSYLSTVDLDGFNPKDDAPWTETREFVAEAALSNNEAIGSVIWDEFPNLFVLTAELKSDPRFRQPLRFVMGREADRAAHVIKQDGRAIKVTVHSKIGPLGKKKNAEGKWYVDTDRHSPEDLKAALEAVRSLLLAKYSA